MKTAENKTNFSPHAHQNGKPFFQKNGESAFFSDGQTDLQTKPFFSRQVTKPFIQPKLKIGQPDDKYEHEADRVADAVISPKGTVPAIQQKCADCGQEDKLQTKRKINSNSGLNIKRQLSSQQSMGRLLPGKVQSEMGRKMGSDFKDVNIHTDTKAIQMNQDLGAKAFTHGKDIYFNKGQFSPGTTEGKRLLAHELTHVTQQGGAGGRFIQKQENGTPSPDAEDNSFDFDFELLPPAIKFTIGNWMLQANTGSAELQFSQNLMRYSLGYSYGGNIFAGINRPGFGSRLGVDPTSGATSLSIRHDQFRFGGSVSPDSGAFGLRFGYGAPLLPMPGALSESVYAGWAGASSILGGLGSMQDPISFYQAHSDDVDAVMGTVHMLQPLADEDSARFGAGLKFTYNPDSGVLISGGMQWRF